MAFPVSSTWNLLDFSGLTLGSLLTLPPSEVAVYPSGAPFSYGPSGALTVDSTGESSIWFDLGLPSIFTFEITLRCARMPVNTGDLATAQLGFTVSDDAGRGVSLYFSAQGLAVSRVDDYGSVTELPGTTDIAAAIRSSYKTVRVAVDSSKARAYVLTGDLDVTAEVKYILPVSQTPTGVGDRARLTFFGTPTSPVEVEILAVRIASTLVLPDQPPVANAGPDRVLAVGQAVRFDGRASFDLEGAPLTYRWELVDAPDGSQYAAEVSSGSTIDDGDADGYTTILSCTPGALPAWLAVGDILVISGDRHRVASFDNGIGEVVVELEAVSDSLTDTPFRLFRQSFLVGSDTETPYALPDRTGIYRVQLTVNDGTSDSEPAEALASVVAARAPTGVEPDVAPLWGLLGDEWQYIENRGIFEEAWRGVAQILSGKLLEVWQYQYNRSIRDAQRTFQRKWLPLRPLVVETAPEDVIFRPKYGVLRASHDFTGGAAAVTGETLTIQYVSATGIHSVDTTLSAGDLATVVAELNASLTGTGVEAFAYAVERVDPSYRHEGVLTTVDDGDADRVTPILSVYPSSLPTWIAAGDIVVCDNTRSTVLSFDNGLGQIVVDDDVFQDAYSLKPYRLYRICRLGLRSSSVAFQVAAGTAATLLGLPTATYGYRYGEGSLITTNTYYAGDGMSWDVAAGDLLVLNNGQSFAVERTVSGPLDPYAGQRLLLADDLPADASTDWILPSVYVTSTDFSMECVYPGDLLRAEAHTTAVDTVVTAEVLGVSTVSLAVIPRSEWWEAYAPSLEMQYLGVLRRNAIPIDPLLVSLPTIQDLIPVGASPTEWRENVDYTLGQFYREIDGSEVPVLQFRSDTFVGPDTDPPDVFWAEYAIYDNEPAVENLFGSLVGFLRDDSSGLDPDFNYVSGVAGLMYAHLRGPSVGAIRTGAQVLLGQPFAEFSGTIEEVRADFSPLKGRLAIRDVDTVAGVPSDIVRTYYYRKDPLDLTETSGLADNPATGVPWALGDSVEQFALLGGGIEIADMYNSPNWFIPYVRSGMMSELEKFHTYLIEFNLDLVSLVNLELLLAFALKTRPTYTHVLLVGDRNHTEDLDLTDDLLSDIALEELDTISGDGPAHHYDDYRGDGSVWTAHDDGSHFDAAADVPLDLIEFDLELDWAPTGPITFDSIFFLDTSVVDVTGAHTGIPGSSFSPTYDMTLEAGTYRVTVAIKSTGVIV